MTNEKYFPKTISHLEFGYGLFTNLPRIIVAREFSPSSFKLKRVSYLSWQNTYPKLKTTSHIKLKFFWWTKLIENSLFAKYIISVAAPLIAVRKSFCLKFPTSKYEQIEKNVHPYYLKSEGRLIFIRAPNQN